MWRRVLERAQRAAWHVVWHAASHAVWHVASHVASKFLRDRYCSAAGPS